MRLWQNNGVEQSINHSYSRRRKRAIFRKGYPFPMTEVLSASQMQKLQEVLVNRLSENKTSKNNYRNAMKISCGVSNDKQLWEDDN